MGLGFDSRLRLKARLVVFLGGLVLCRFYDGIRIAKGVPAVMFRAALSDW